MCIQLRNFMGAPAPAAGVPMLPTSLIIIIIVNVTLPSALLTMIESLEYPRCFHKP